MFLRIDCHYYSSLLCVCLEFVGSFVAGPTLQRPREHEGEARERLRTLLAPIDGALVKLDHKLKTHDVVEIITSPQATPSRDWLNFIKTSQAKSKIRQWFKKANREENIALGRDMLAEAARRQGKKLADLVKPEFYAPLLKRFTLNEMDDGRFIKVANVVGQTMKYHPHGDASIGDALVVLVNRGYLIEGQGNFGNIHTGDRAAAPRYIECRLTDLAATQLFNKDLTEFVPSYDGRNKEPVVLPSKLPLLLMLGADGIAVGLSTCILPHNFTELLQAQIAILQKKPFTLLPDFQQGGLMDIRDYDEGRGRIRMRAVVDQKDESTLVVRELPYGVTTESLIDSIEDAAKKGKIKIRGIRDYTSGHVEIEIALPNDANIAKTLQGLYAFTKCEVALALHPVVIRDRRPVEMSVHDILRHNTRRLVELLRKELQIERHKIDEALQAASLVRLFIVHRIYKRIEECPTAAAVRQAVLDGLAPFRDQLRRDITAADLDMLLAIPIRRISLYDINKSRKEEDNLLADFAEVEKNLADVTAYTVKYLRNLLRDYAGMYPRRTRVQAFDTIEMRELTATRLEIYHDPEKGYIGHKDVAGETPALVCSSLDKLVIVWDDGRYKVVPPPEKLFVDKNVIHLGIYDRDRVYTMVYVADPIAHLKRFRLGGVIQNKEYSCTPEGASKILFFADDDPPVLYVKYAPRKGQQIGRASCRERV